MIPQYALVLGRSEHDLQRNVNIALKGGWTLQGGVSMTSLPEIEGKSSVGFAQAITRLIPSNEIKQLSLEELFKAFEK